MTEVLNTVSLALQGAIGIAFDVIDGLHARDFLFGMLACATVYRLLLIPILGGKLSVGGKSERNISSSNEKGSEE